MKQWKQVLFSLLVLVLFFGGLELVLGLFGVEPLLLTEDPLVGFASQVPLFVEAQHADGTPVLRTAPNKLAWFNQQEFPRDKAPKSFRIFCLGGSTTYGRPFKHEASYVGWLGAFLEAAEPGRTWEVVNAGGVSYASYRVANLLKELVQYQPDLFIIYTGQNEFLEERSYGGLANLPSWVIGLDAALNSTRLYSGMKRMYRAWRPGSQQESQERYEVSGEVDEILRHTQGPTSYHRDDQLKHQVLTHFRLNLERMVRLAQESGADVILINPAVNLKDMSPFKSEHRQDLTELELGKIGRLIRQAEAAQATGQLAEALARYQQALDIDGRYAELHFRVGRLLFELERYDEAELSFRRAVDEDVAPLRMLSSMPAIIAEVAADHQVPLIDFQLILRQAYLQKYGHAVFGQEVFLDHVHTNVDGYRLLGLGLFDQLRRMGIVSGTEALGRDRIAVVSRQVMTTLNKRDYSDAFVQLAKVLDWAGKFEEAKNLLVKHLELFGPEGSVAAQLGGTLARQGASDEAIHQLTLAVSSGFRKAWVHGLLGDLYREQGDHRLAMEAYQDELRLDNRSHVSHTHLGLLFVAQADRESARAHFEEALQLNPEFVPAAVNLVALLFDEQRYSEALARGMEILEDHPDEYKVHYLVGTILLRQGDRDQAIEHLEAALRVVPGFEPARVALVEAKGSI